MTNANTSTPRISSTPQPCVIYRPQNVRVVVDEPENRLHAHVGHIALVQMVIVQQRAETERDVLVPVQHAIATTHIHTHTYTKLWFVCKQNTPREAERKFAVPQVLGKFAQAPGDAPHGPMHVGNFCAAD